MIRRERSEQDKRVVTISLSEDGSEFMHHEMMDLGSYFTRVMEAFSDEEKKTLFGMAHKVFAVLNQRRNLVSRQKIKKYARLKLSRNSVDIESK